MTIFVFNNNTNRMERFERGLNDPMPYNTGNTLTVRDFRGSSKANILFTDRRVMEAWNAFRRYYGRPIDVGFAFKRIWEGGHGQQSQHYTGTAFDVGQKMTAAQRNELYNAAIRSGIWGYVEPLSLTPSWVHFDRRIGAVSGYPTLREGNRGIYVMLLQDALNALGRPTNGMDGIFGPGTRNAVVNFQRTNGLAADGIVGPITWARLVKQAVGIGKTATVID